MKTAKIFFLFSLIFVCLSVIIVSAGQADDLHDSIHPPANLRSASPWRRTVDGWQLSGSWNGHPDPTSQTPLIFSLHPLIVAILQLLLSVAALVAFSPAAGKENITRLGRVDSTEKHRPPLKRRPSSKLSQ